MLHSYMINTHPLTLRKFRSYGALAPGVQALVAWHAGGEYRHVEVAADKKATWRVEEEFIGAIRGQEAIRFTSFETGLRYMQFTQAVHESCRTGQSVNVQLQ